MTVMPEVLKLQQIGCHLDYDGNARGFNTAANWFMNGLLLMNG